MQEEPKINPGHSGVRTFLRIAGPLVLLVGVILVIVGIANFRGKSAFSVTPVCMFTGLPLLFVGSVMSMFGYMGAVARYQAQEIAPVGKDTFNYLAGGTKGGLRTVARAVGQGLSEGLKGSVGEEVLCAQCGHANEAGSKFCDQCGAAIGSRTCPSCNETNDPDAKFCDNCGQKLT